MPQKPVPPQQQSIIDAAAQRQMMAGGMRMPPRPTPVTGIAGYQDYQPLHPISGYKRSLQTWGETGQQSLEAIGNVLSLPGRAVDLIDDITGHKKPMPPPSKPEIRAAERGPLADFRNWANQFRAFRRFNSVMEPIAEFIGDPLENTSLPNKAMTVFHASPHAFDKFTMANVRKGTGGLAQGYGAYVAQEPDVAKDYYRLFMRNRPVEPAVPTLFKGEVDHGIRDEIANRIETMIKYKQFRRNQREDIKLLDRRYYEPDPQVFIEDFVDLARARDALREPGGWPNNDRMREVLDVIEPYGVKTDDLIKPQPKPWFYHVDLPDEHIPLMLDWDRKIGEQNIEVLRALEKLPKKRFEGPFFVSEYRAPKTEWPKGLDQYESKWNVLNLKGEIITYGSRDAAEAAAKKAFIERPIYDMNETGAEFYRKLNQMSQKSGMDETEGKRIASDMLKNSGLSGIKYLDQWSRAAGEGTSNFVVFDPSIFGETIRARNYDPVIERGITMRAIQKRYPDFKIEPPKPPRRKK